MRLKPLAICLVMALALPAARCQVVFPAGLYASVDRWIDDRGQPFSLGELRGTPTVVTMAYGACRRVCSSSLRTMEQVQRLADQHRVALNFLVIGLDPSEDTPADWAQFRADRNLAQPNWHFLSGTDTTIRRAAGRLGIHYWRYGDHTLHDFKIVLLDAEGATVRSLDRVDDPLTRLLP